MKHHADRLLKMVHHGKMRWTPVNDAFHPDDEMKRVRTPLDWTQLMEVLYYEVVGTKSNSHCLLFCIRSRSGRNMERNCS